MITAKFEASDGDISEVEEATFSQQELVLFETYHSNFERMSRSRIFDGPFPTLKNLTICSEKGVTFEVSDFDRRDLYELLHVIRPFILKREPASFDKTLSIFGKQLKGELFRKSFKQLRQLNKDGEHSFIFNWSLNDTPLFSDRVFSSWLNGVEYHGDEEKKMFIEKLESQFGSELTLGVVISILKSRVKAINMLHHMVKIPLSHAGENLTKASR